MAIYFDFIIDPSNFYEYISIYFKKIRASVQWYNLNDQDLIRTNGVHYRVK